MASWGSLFDLSWWGVKKFYGAAYWVVWGTPETREQKSIRETNERLEEMEKKIEQIWALQTHMTEINPNDPNLMSSLVIVEKNGDVEIFPSNTSIDNPEEDPFEEGEINCENK